MASSTSSSQPCGRVLSEAPAKLRAVMSNVFIERASGDGQTVDLLKGDLSAEAFEASLHVPVIAWDIETTGLDWRSDRIATVQLHVGDSTYVVQLSGKSPERLKALLEHDAPMKILHYAMFDLRFMAYHWDASPVSVACTKIASKLARPTAAAAEHSLAPLVERYFGVQLDKTLRTSDWTGAGLADNQLLYAADDVRFLWPLFAELECELRHQGLIELRDRCFAHLPARVALELGDYPDVFAC
jgi:ribonuclease D